MHEQQSINNNLTEEKNTQTNYFRVQLFRFQINDH